MVKEKWISTHIKDIATIYGRIGFRGYTKQDIVKPGFGAISLSPSNIKDGKVTYASATYISWEKYEESPEIKLTNGDVVLVKTGSTFGKTAYIDRLPWPTTLNPQIVVFKKLKIHAKLFAYFMASKNIQEQISAVIVGGAIPTLSQEQVYAFDIVYPPDAKEQAAIAEALSDIDSLIFSLQKLIEKKKAIKQGAMQELLTGKKRLPGFSGEWNEGCIGDYCRCIRGVSYNGGTDLFPDENSYSFRLLRANNIQNGNFVPNDVQFVKKSCVSEEQVLHTNDILVCMANGSKPLVGKNCFLNVRNGVYTFGAFMGCIRARTSSTCMKYIFQIMNSTTYWENISLLLSGSSINNLRPNDILDMTYKFPTAIEQQAIAQVLSDMDSEIEQLEKKLAKYQQIKQGMMQELLTGRIRLKKGEMNV